MDFLKKPFITFIILLGLITFSQAETSWITKKKDNKDKVEKVEKTSSNWIKKKKKENTENFKKLKKENKSWITKKSKEEIKQEKEKLDIYLDIKKLPKAEFYIAAESSSGELFYGYVNSRKSSKLLNINNKDYYELSDGFVYSSDGKTVCVVISQLALVFNNLGGKVDVECKNKLKFNGIYVQQQGEGYGTGQSNKGDTISFKFFNSENRSEQMQLAYNNFSKRNQIIALTSPPKTKIDVKPKGKYYALLIGNSKYAKWASLTSPKNDIEGVYEVLKNNYDFEKIIKVNDAKRSDIFNAFQKLNKLTTDEDYVLIYYSGHGMRTENQAFWIPVEAEQEWGGGSWINTNDIHVAISKIKAKHILLLSDSCYVGNAFKGNNDEIKETQKKNLDKKFIENILLERARWFISSGGNSQVMDEVVKGHSLFAYKLIDLLKNNKTYLTSDVLFSEISKYNSQFLFSGGYNQSPVIGTVDTWGHLGGHFVFLPKK